MPDSPYLHAHRSGHSLWIDMIWVPPSQRGRGVARKLYEEWEASLPPDITRVEVFAADTDGTGNRYGFWEAMGFEFVYAAEDPEMLGYEAQHRMVKGVNGHSTPEPIWVEHDEEE